MRLGREGSVTAWSVACVLAWLAACGGGDGVTNPTPSPTPPPAPVQTVVGQGNFSIAAPDPQYSYFVRRSISTSAAGALDVTVDWTHATNTVWMYLSEGECSADQFA